MPPDSLAEAGAPPWLGDIPLAQAMRPATLAEVVGQDHLLGPGRPLRAALDARRPHSMILWGPPGVGKTTLAQLLADALDCHWVALSAVLAGVKEIRAAVDTALDERAQRGRATMVFVDEVHRFNKAQQDAFLPHVESGLMIWVGATTENPSFEVNRALLSRAAVYALQRLSDADLQGLVERACARYFPGLQWTPDALQSLVASADGDGRRLFNHLELLATAAGLLDRGAALDAARTVTIDAPLLAQVLGARVRQFDRDGDLFYAQISALHKSVRGSHPNAALYWLVRMLDGGADPLYLARRIVRMAIEDIGLADPRALRLALDATEVYERLGSPEGELALAQAVLYLACAAKSQAGYAAYQAAQRFVRQHGSAPVPLHLRPAANRWLQEQGFGRDYRNPHDEPHAYAAAERYMPDGLAEPDWYAPQPRGLEIRIGEKLAWLRQLDQAAQAGPGLA